MIRILFVSSALNKAGTETFMINVIRNCDRTKFCFDFLITQKEETANSREVENELNCKIYRIPSRGDNFGGYYKAILHFFKRHACEYNAIHWCGGNMSSIFPLLVAKIYNVPIRIVHSHNSEAKGCHNKLFHMINKLYICSLCTHYFACSISAAEFFYYKGTNYTIINNGIDIERFRFNKTIKDEIRSSLKIEEDSLVIGHVGRFDTVKNHSFILDIFDEIKRLKQNALLILIGTGDMLDTIKMKAATLGLDKSILFIGQKEDVFKYYQCMDMFLMPSLFEGLPFVLIEAQTAGLPCVISDTIDKNVDITGNVYFLSLQSSAKVWAGTILEVMTKFTRTVQDEKIEKAGYSIFSTVRYLEKVYSGEK